MSPTVQMIDPLLDPRWPVFLSRQHHASVFHTPEWLAALRQTYGYQPVAFTTSAPGEELKNGIVFCRVQNTFRGYRMVSMPFSDHCQPLVETYDTLRIVLSSLAEQMNRENWKYIEIRPMVFFPSGLAMPRLSTGEQFYFHKLDLRPNLQTIFHNFHKSCVQRKIQRGERENLKYEAGRSDRLLDKFYGLLLLTRRRHQLPPQPLLWFRNLVERLGDHLTIRVVSKDGQPIASMLTILFKKSLVYKYGCSDARFHNLGGMPLLFWKAIQEAKALGAEELDLGRSEMNNAGLVNFKEHLGAQTSKLVYQRIGRNLPRSTTTDWKVRYVRKAISHMPDPFLRFVADRFYRYVG